MGFFQLVVCMVVFSHLSASWSDPGVVAKDHTGMYLAEYERQYQLALNAEGQGDIMAMRRLRKKFCKKCEIPKPLGAHHCSACNRCVRNMVSCRFDSLAET
jgi:hypothetical protein